MPAACGILLAGGRSTRMGTDKLALERQGTSLARSGLDALLGVCERVAVASPPRPELAGQGVDFVLEDPPFGGPASGISAALRALASYGDEVGVYVLAGDLTEPSAVVEALRSAPLGPDGVVLIDPEGWPQYLAGRYRLGSLRRALNGDARNRSVRSMLRALNLALVPVGGQITADIDTPEQARGAGFEDPGRLD